MDQNEYQLINLKVSPRLIFLVLSQTKLFKPTPPRCMVVGFDDIFIFRDLNGSITLFIPFSAATTFTFLRHDLYAALNNLRVFSVAAEFKLNIRVHFNASAFFKKSPT